MNDQFTISQIPRLARRGSLALATCAALATTALAAPQGTEEADWFVDPDLGNDLNAGGDWGAGNAFETIEAALAAAGTGDVIWVKADASSVHLPAGGTRDSTFLIDQPIILRGGFDGTEDFLSERGTGLFTSTILSGDFNGDSSGGTVPDIDDDAYHVVTVQDGVDDVVLDGFLIRYGYADGTSTLSTDSDVGGGVFFEDDSGGRLDIQLTNLTIEDCNAIASGGGIYVDSIGGTSSVPSYFARVTVRSCAAFDPSASTGDGGGIYISGGNQFFSLINCRLDGNRAIRGGGAFTREDDGGFSWQNCLFVDNVARSGGALAQISPLDSSFSHCTFAYNQVLIPIGGTGGGSALYIEAASSVTNIGSSILTNNRTTQFQSGGAPPLISTNTVTLGTGAGGVNLDITYSNVGFDTSPPFPGWFGTGSISQNSLFVNGGARDLRLQSTSPCVDAADDGDLLDDFADLNGDGDDTEETPLDLGEDTREQDVLGLSATGVDTGGAVAGAITDMGCFERIP